MAGPIAIEIRAVEFYLKLLNSFQSLRNLKISQSMRIYCSLFIVLGYFASLGAQSQHREKLPKFRWTESTFNLTADSVTIFGSLILPKTKSKIPVVLIIAGSGPTDRDGNNVMMKNNSLKMLAEGLGNLGIASVRYDKRGIAESNKSAVKEIDLRFDHYVKDAENWIKLLKSDPRFSEVTVIGHSEGSLIGMLATVNADANRFVSLAGSGRRADIIILDQLKKQSPKILNAVSPLFDSLRAGITVDSIDPMLNSLFRPSVQPYMISWMNYDPVVGIKKVKVPVLIIQGTTDIQVSAEDANLLAAAKPDSDLKFINGMNHVLKIAPADPVANQRTYLDPNLVLAEELVPLIFTFIVSK